LLFRVKMPSTNTFLAVSAAVGCALAQRVPAAAQVVDQKIFNVLENVPPPAIANDSTVCHLYTSTSDHYVTR
jgi:gluconolactonase